MLLSPANDHFADCSNSSHHKSESLQPSVLVRGICCGASMVSVGALVMVVGVQRRLGRRRQHHGLSISATRSRGEYKTEVTSTSAVCLVQP